MKPCGASPECLHTICSTCYRPLRTTGELSGDHPGTVRSQRQKLCGGCFLTQGKPRLKKPEISELEHAHNVRNLNNFMARIKGTSKAKVSHRG